MQNLLEIEILRYVRLLDQTQQTHLRDYARDLVPPEQRPLQPANQGMLRWVGQFDRRSLQEMQGAIDDAFGQIDQDE